MRFGRNSLPLGSGFPCSLYYFSSLGSCSPRKDFNCAWSEDDTILIDSTASEGRGISPDRKKSWPMALLARPIISLESATWHVIPLRWSPSNVYLLGLKDPMSRPLLYDSFMWQGGISANLKWRNGAFFVKDAQGPAFRFPSL